MTSRRSIGQEEASGQNMLVSLPALLSSADLVPLGFTLRRPSSELYYAQWIGINGFEFRYQIS
jgi:hypothetical protein